MSKKIGNETFYTVLEAANIIGGISVPSVRKMFRDKRLKGYKLYEIFISESSLKEFLGVTEIFLPETAE